MKQINSLRQKVIDVAQILPKYGLVWMAGGTICARDPETGYVVVTPSGLPYHMLTCEDMIVTDMAMNIIDGKHRPSVALNLWTGFLKARPDLNAIVHTHSPFATAFAVNGEPIPIITETQANWFGSPVPVTPYLSVDDERFSTLPIELLGQGFGLLLGQHGVITLGADLDDALERAVTLEEAARTYSIAKTIGNPLIFSTEMARNSFNYYHHKYGQIQKDED
jgi:L-ribulose-5-phosphate 4-epimerase